MMRWTAMLAGLFFSVLLLTGCSQRCFVTEPDLEHYKNLVSQGLATKPDTPPTALGMQSMEPTTVLHPEREPWPMSLAEAIARSLENGTVGLQSVRSPGSIGDDLLTIGELAAIEARSESIRVLAINPALIGAAVEAQMARFDPVVSTGISWTTTDQPVQGLGSFSNGQAARFESSIAKPMATGGTLATIFSTSYSNLVAPPSNFPLQNPSYTPRMTFVFDQPLLQGFGVDINQMLPSHPGTATGSSLTANASSALNAHLGGISRTGFNSPSLMVARIRFDQSRADLERVVNFKLLNVETAYWNLYGTYVTLYASEQALRQSYEAWRISKAKYEAGQIAITQFAQTRGQYEQFRGDRIQALGRVLEAERVLRGLLGLPVEDGKQIVPLDAPTLAPYQPDWRSAVHDCLTLRPELVAARQELRVREVEQRVQENYLKPDLRFVSSYSIGGLGSRLDGNGTFFDSSVGRDVSSNAFRSLASNHYNDWSIGLNLSMPLGYRQEHAGMRRARLSMVQAQIGVKFEEMKAERFLAKAYRDVYENYKVIEARRAQRKAFGEQVEARFKEFVAGKTTADFLLEAQRQWASALSAEYQAVVSYNNALATFQFAKGTLMHHDNVTINEGPLPACAQVRAVEHERERSHALVLRERANPVPRVPMSVDAGTSGLPHLPEGGAPTVPALLEGAGPLPLEAEQPMSSLMGTPSAPGKSSSSFASSSLLPIPQSQVQPVGGTLSSTPPVEATIPVTTVPGPVRGLSGTTPSMPR